MTSISVPTPHVTSPSITNWFSNSALVRWLSPITGNKVIAVVGAIGALAGATISLITSLGAVSWSAAQISLVTAEVGAVIAFLTAIIAHYWPGTKQQPVAVAGGFTALVTATLTLGTGFAWWHFTDTQISALVAVVSTVIGVGSALLARNLVTAAGPAAAATDQTSVSDPRQPAS